MICPEFRIDFIFLPGRQTIFSLQFVCNPDLLIHSSWYSEMNHTEKLFVAHLI